MARSPEHAVRRVLQEYADRGVIRELSEETTRGRRVDFRFLWVFDKRFTLRYNVEKDNLTFVELIPEVRRGSRLYRDVKRFLAEHSGPEAGLPKHRVVDPKRARVEMRSRAGAVSIVLQVKRRQRTYGVRKILNLVHDLFLFLRSHHEEHLWEHYGLPQE